MEDFIYILAGVAYLAYSIYSAGQKKKKKLEQAAQHAYSEPEVSEPEPRKEPISSIFDEILGVKNYDLNIEEEVFDEPQTNVSMQEKEALDSIPKEEGVRTTVLHKTPEQIELDEESEEDDDENEYNFDLKNAIISSEILNPPYIKR